MGSNTFEQITILIMNSKSYKTTSKQSTSRVNYGKLRASLTYCKLNFKSYKIKHNQEELL